MKLRLDTADRIDERGLEHSEIADLVRRSKLLAERGDEGASHRAAERVFRALVRHVDSEHRRILNLEGAQRARLIIGQEAVLGCATRFATNPAVGIGADLLAQLERQSAIEEMAFGLAASVTDLPPPNTSELGFATEWANTPPPVGSPERNTCDREEGSMYTHMPLSHAQLLEKAHDALEAAREHDPGRVQTNTLRLFDALTEHVLAERPWFLQLRSGDALLLRHGQQRIVDQLLALASSAAHDDCRCHCEAIAGDVITHLATQADAETRYLFAPVD